MENDVNNTDNKQYLIRNISDEYVENYIDNNIEDINRLDEKEIVLNKLLETYESNEPPDFIRENVLKAYRKNFRYRIIWTKLGDYLRNLVFFDVEFLRLPLLLSSITGLFLLVLVVYYQYSETPINPTKLIAMEKTPEIIISPSPFPYTNDGLNKAKSNSDNENDKIPAISKNNKTGNSVKTIPKRYRFRSSGIKDLNLLNIKSIYISDFPKDETEKELYTFLIENIENTGFVLLEPSETVTNTEYGLLKKKENFIEIIDPNTNKVLWREPIGKIHGSPKEVAKKIVGYLIEDIKNKKGTKK